MLDNSNFVLGKTEVSRTNLSRFNFSEGGWQFSASAKVSVDARFCKFAKLIQNRHKFFFGGKFFKNYWVNLNVERIFSAVDCLSPLKEITKGFGG